MHHLLIVLTLKNGSCPVKQDFSFADMTVEYRRQSVVSMPLQCSKLINYAHQRRSLGGLPEARVCCKNGEKTELVLEIMFGGLLRLSKPARSRVRTLISIPQ